VGIELLTSSDDKNVQWTAFRPHSEMLCANGGTEHNLKNSNEAQNSRNEEKRMAEKRPFKIRQLGEQFPSYLF